MKKTQYLYSFASVLIGLMTLLAMASLAFVAYFIIREALPLFEEVSVREFLLGSRWMPINFVGDTSFGIFNFLMGTLYVSLTAMILALFVGLGAAVWLSCAATERVRAVLYPVIDLLAGIPSVIYGFIGLVTLVRFFMRGGVPTGLCVLAAGILLSVMLLPFLISSCAETMLAASERYMNASLALGASRWHTVIFVVLPASVRGIMLSSVLAIGRAMGETMAVMMVMGNANLFPRLFGKGETIAAVIALEMGTAVVNSTHYHALYAAGLVLMAVLFIINAVIGCLRERIRI